MPNFLGIEIGGTKLQLLVTDEQLNQLDSFRFTVNPSLGANGIRSTIEDVIAKTKSYNIERIGVGFGGPIHKSSGKIFTSYNVAGWSGFSIKDWLEQVSGCEVLVENDANVAALAEAVHGAAKDHRTVFYVTLGSGVGAGLVIDKKIYQGAVQGEMEFGHIRLSKNGLSVQDSCSGWAVNQKIRLANEKFPDTILSTFTKQLNGNESRGLAEAVRKNDPMAISILDSTLDDLAFALSHVVHLANPEIIILGGGLSLMGNLLRDGIESRIKKYLMDAFQPGPMIQLASLKENVVPYGAVLLAINGQTL